ncbi:MAG: hypothetical protein HY606_03775, partial [Planctomycetes bacterium]|nr:hypothetical protein [Planctomycetota bacterium]
MKKIITVLLIVAFTTSCSFSADLEMQNLLPIDNEIGSWIRTGPSHIYKQDELFKYIDGGADIFLEYGFNLLISQEYSNDDQVVVIDIYRMKDSESAFGIYSFKRDKILAPLEIGNEGIASDNVVYFWQDDFYVFISSFQEGVKGGLMLMAKAISTKIGKKGNLPDILSHLPSNYRLHGSEKLISGIIAFNNLCHLAQDDIFDIDIKGVLAEYELNQDKFKVLLLKYNNKADVQSAFEKLVKFYKEKVKEENILKQTADRLIVKDGAYYLARIKSTYLVVALE